jgi:hypothetical protein
MRWERAALSAIGNPFIDLAKGIIRTSSFFFKEIWAAVRPAPPGIQRPARPVPGPGRVRHRAPQPNARTRHDPRPGKLVKREPDDHLVIAEAGADPIDHADGLEERQFV